MKEGVFPSPQRGGEGKIGRSEPLDQLTWTYEGEKNKKSKFGGSHLKTCCGS